LQNAGYDVETAPNGKVALEQIVAAAPDAVVTDIEMPKMSGEELCKALYAQLPGRKFPIFVATSLTDVRHREWARSIPNLHFLEKPLSSRRLLVVLGECFAAECKREHA
jgi:CheY-like chemotaxis protein